MPFQVVATRIVITIIIWASHKEMTTRNTEKILRKGISYEDRKNYEIAMTESREMGIGQHYGGNCFEKNLM